MSNDKKPYDNLYENYPGKIRNKIHMNVGVKFEYFVHKPPLFYASVTVNIVVAMNAYRVILHPGDEDEGARCA